MIRAWGLPQSSAFTYRALTRSSAVLEEVTAARIEGRKGRATSLTPPVRIQ